MKRIISFLTFVVLLTTLTFCVSAAAPSENGSYNLKYIADKTSVEVDESFNISVYLTDATNENNTIDYEDGFVNLSVYNSYNTTFATFNKDSSVFNYGISASDVEEESGVIAIVMDNKVTTSIVKSTPLFVLNFTATSAGNAIFTLDTDSGFSIADNTKNNNEVYDDNSTVTPATVEITAGGSTGSSDIVIEEETFDTSATGDLQTKDETVTSGTVKVDGKEFATMGANGSIKTYFKKNTSGNVLKAGTYGITVKIGETTYKFPGKADVPADKAWAIKLVIPNGQFKDGTAATTFENATAFGD